MRRFAQARAFLPLCLIGWLLMAQKAQNTEPSFEKAMERLEAIVEEMESGKMPLEDLLVRYEEGMKLVKVCQERLTRAEEKIEIITRDHAGKLTVKNFDTAEASGAGTASNTIEKENNDDVSLF
jgi:exodeoxyribonuclease VII small subunit